MGKFIDWLLGRTIETTGVEEEIPVVDQEIKLPPGASKINIAKIPRIKNPVLTFKRRPGANEFEQPEYDLAEVGRIEDTEAYVRRAFRYKEGLMFKEGWELIGPNTRTIRYVKERFRQMDQATGVSHSLIIRGVAADLVRFSNAYLVKVRKPEASGGKPRTIPGRKKELKPVAGYFSVPPTTVEIKRDKFGKVLKYRQMMPDQSLYRDFKPENVIHFFFDRKKGFLVGTPTIIPVKDDIRALRRIEENIEMLVYQCLFPLFHYKVGTENAPAQTYPDGTKEVDVVKAEIEYMPAEGAIVTPERHEITAVGSEGRALRAEGYLNHFKSRVFAGLGVSAVDMGEGDTANRATADNMSRNMVDDVKTMQRELEVFINEYMIKELLLESTFENPISEENIVQIKFHEIDLDAKIKVENHAINAYAGHAMTHTELRNSFGKEPLTEEQELDTFWKRIREPELLIQSLDEPYSAEAKALARANTTSISDPDLQEEGKARKAELSQQAASRASGQSGRSTPAKRSSTGGQRAAKAATTPSNQHGTKQSPEKRKSAFRLSDMVAEGNIMTKIYNDLRDDAITAIGLGHYSEGWLRSTALAAGTQMREHLSRLVRMKFREGFRKSGAILEFPEEKFAFDILEQRVEAIVNRYVNRLVKRVESDLKKATSKEDATRLVVLTFDALQFRSRFIYNSEANKATNYGVARGLKNMGREQASVIIQNNACDECKSHGTIIMLENITIADLPGWHPNCTCMLSVS